MTINSRMDGNCSDPHLLAGTEDSQSNLSAISNQNFRKLHLLVIDSVFSRIDASEGALEDDPWNKLGEG